MIRRGRFCAGLFEPPPEMVNRIYNWCTAATAANNLAGEQKVSQRINEFLLDLTPEKIEEGWQFIEANGNPENIERDVYQKRQEKELKIFNDMLKASEYKIRKMQKEMKLDKSIKMRARPWKKISKTFKVDVDGWKHSKILDNATQEGKDSADARYGSIKVEMIEGNIQGNSKAYWLPTKSVIRIAVGGDLKGIIRHELTHWAQTYLEHALSIEGIGKPSRRLRNKELDQNARFSPMLKKKMKQMGLDQNDLHDMDDIEFYTELADAIYRFEISVKINDGEYKENMLRKFVGDNGKASSPFFETLRKGSPSKWRKAVKELAKAVL